MPIQEENIVFVESQVMDDVPEGGGAATGRVITDGQLNNVFEDISDLDRAYGRFNLRKAFLAVRSVDTALYGGAKLAITQRPTDEALDYTLFTTKNAFDARASAADRVGAYLYKGPMWHGALYENHIVGMRQIRLIQRVGTAVATIGKTLCLTQYEGDVGQKEQYVRVVKASSVVAAFTDPSTQKDFERLIVAIDLSDSLRYDFTGHTPNISDSYNYTTGVRVRDTTVADATQYYSARPVVESAAIGDLEIRADSIFASLVPSAQTETPLVYQPMSPDLIEVVDAGGGHTVEVAQTAHTLALEVTAENRRLNWIETLAPLPRPGSLTVAFMSQGNWYLLSDNGSGALGSTDPSIGAGTLDYETGVAAITLGALPDAGSQINWVWSSPVHYRQRLGAYPAANRRVEILLGEPVEPGTLTLTYISGGQPRVSTAATTGVLSGTGAGYLSHTTGELWFTPDLLPDVSTQIGIQYQPQAIVTQTQTGLSESGGLTTFSVGEAIVPGTVMCAWSTQYTERYSYYYEKRECRAGLGGGGTTCVTTSFSDSSTATNRIDHRAWDDGAGGIVDAGGVVDYIDGDITLPVLPPVSQTTWNSDTPEWETKEQEIGSVTHVFTSGIVNVTYVSQASAAQAPVDIALDWPPLVVKVLPPLLVEAIVPGSLRFSLGSQSYEDRGTGLLYSDSINAGSIDYRNGLATLTYWAGTGGPNVTSCLTRIGDWVGTTASFRTELAPLKPEALSIQVTTEDGALLTASADADGAIVGTDVLGFVNYQFGTANIAFGHLDVDGVTWIPRRVDPSTLRYNAVSYSYLPLDADILGIDPVRLPADGRVPVLRKGDIVYVMHADTTGAITPTAGAPVSVGRTRLAWARVIDAAGDSVSSTLYTLNRANGTLTFPSLEAIDTPVTIRHTVADLRMLTDVQISGWLSLSRALSHNFPADESIIASCLIFGDRRARVSLTFDQASWTNVWSDTLIGSNATATLNLIDFPIEVTNEGADTDRWLLRCTNSSTHDWELISENRGLVWAGTYAPGEADVAPINARTRTWDEETRQWIGGTPYMVIPGHANGGGWSTGNVVRINTIGAIADFWIARSVQQSEEPLDDGYDSVEIYALGNVDRP